ncbi:MAG: PHP domain-containing protein [Treponema sp.]|jgi:predicted metal-dependent phosphoesterase TrpH|nr:PHP domain-containing protein [Treponema sp.]
MIDLHTHSTASDGSMSPSELIDAAAEKGLSAIALTDHDTIDGNEEAAIAAKNKNITFIPGVELSIKWEPGEFHLLGLGIKEVSPSFKEALEELCMLREKRNREILDKMNELNIDVQYEEIKALSKGKVIGRPHFAAFLVNRKIVKNREQAFDRYLGKNRPFYVSKQGLDLERAIRIIKESGGIPVLAHPMSLYVSWGKLPDLLKSFAEKGIEGIEAWHPAIKVSACKRLETLGRSLGFHITAGSDFHGALRLDRKLGITAGKTKIEDSFLEIFGERKESSC